MTSLERCLAVLEGKTPDRIPVLPQNFMFAAQTAGYSIGEIANNGLKIAESHRICQDMYGYDGCIIDVDDASLAEACGAKVIYDNPEEPALVDEHNPLISNLRQVPELPLPNPLQDGRLPEWLRATERLVEVIGDHVFIMGRADQGPFDLLCLLRGTQNFMMELISEDPQVIWDALDWCRKAVARFAKAQKDAGAHATSIGEAYAGPNLIHPDMYRLYAMEHQKALIQEVQDYGIPVSLHICGASDPIIADMSATGAKILEVDWQVNMARAHEICQSENILMGNINPANPLALGTPRQVDAAAKKVIEDCRGQNLFLSSGCAIGRKTPPENLRALVNAARKYGITMT